MKTLTAAVMAAFLFMGAQCSPTTDIPAFIAKVQADAVTVCGYMPLADFITAVLQTQQGAAIIAQGANAFAHAICDQVHPAPAAGPQPSNAIPSIAGVPIRGHFVK